MFFFFGDLKKEEGDGTSGTLVPLVPIFKSFHRKNQTRNNILNSIKTGTRGTKGTKVPAKQNRKSICFKSRLELPHKTRSESKGLAPRFGMCDCL